MKQFFISLITSIFLLLSFSSIVNAEMSSTRNFYLYSDKLLTSGQPDEKALKDASKEGIEVVINLVPPSEAIYNSKEAEILRSQNIEYIHIPVSWRSPKKSDLDKFLKEMSRIKDKKVLIHCWSNARASAFAYAFRVSQSPKKQSKEWEILRKVWSDVAGYDLDKDEIWQAYLKKILETK